MAKKGLGRGLSALIGDYRQEEADKGEQIVLLPLEKIKPNPQQPRKFFAEDKLQELAQSLRQVGFLQPIIVIEKGKEYEIVAGERRWRAAQLASLSEIPCIVRHLAEKEITELSLIENVQRENLNALEEAQTYKKLQQLFAYTQEQLAEKMGKSRPYIANMLRLLSLPENIQTMVAEGALTAGHARALLMLSNSLQQTMLAKQIVEKNLSVRQAEEAARLLSQQEMPKKNKKTNKNPDQDPMIKEIRQRLCQQFGTKVAMVNGCKGGKIIIEYYNDDDLQRLIELLLPQERF
jgi:ParB family chromosome partitioning protein